MTTFVTYYRVSTAKQGASGLGLEAQRAAVRSYLNSINGQELATFTETESGKRNDRPELAKALLRCRQTGATLLVAKFDRLSRNAAFLLTLRDSGTKFIAADMPEANNLTIGVLAVIAEHEREMISKRTKEALQAARVRGVKLGNPRIRPGTAETAAAASQAAQEAYRRRAEELRPMIEEAPSKDPLEVSRYLGMMGVRSPQGKNVWNVHTVKRLMKFLGVSA
jgi:DNA invertase Pin-like site-specific DNA recombinase